MSMFFSVLGFILVAVAVGMVSGLAFVCFVRWVVEGRKGIEVKKLPVGEWVSLTSYVRVRRHADDSLDVHEELTSDHSRGGISYW